MAYVTTIQDRDGNARTIKDPEALREKDIELLTNAEMASWFGIDITGTPAEGSDAAAIKDMLDDVSGDSITDDA